jgi:hypothetical protein
MVNTSKPCPSYLRHLKKVVSLSMWRLTYSFWHPIDLHDGQNSTPSMQCRCARTCRSTSTRLLYTSPGVGPYTQRKLINKYAAKTYVRNHLRCWYQNLACHCRSHWPEPWSMAYKYHVIMPMLSTIISLHPGFIEASDTRITYPPSPFQLGRYTTLLW